VSTPAGIPENVNDIASAFSPDLSKQIKQWGLQNVGFDYNIVAVFGSQSTGKSARPALQ
jgi:hypothetical protein